MKEDLAKSVSQTEVGSFIGTQLQSRHFMKQYLSEFKNKISLINKMPCMIQTLSTILLQHLTMHPSVTRQVLIGVKTGKLKVITYDNIPNSTLRWKSFVV